MDTRKPTLEERAENTIREILPHPSIPADKIVQALYEAGLLADVAQIQAMLHSIHQRQEREKTAWRDQWATITLGDYTDPAIYPTYESAREAAEQSALFTVAHRRVTDWKEVHAKA